MSGPAKLARCSELAHNAFDLFPIREIERFATTTGVDVRWPLDYLFAPRVWDRVKLLEEETARFDLGTNPCVDGGRFQERIPRCVFTPKNEMQLQEVMRFLHSIELPYKLRGAGHSFGGQTLIRDGAVVNLRKLSFIERETEELVTVGGGTLWLELVEHLAPDRRPIVLSDDLHATVGGALAVGGFGDTSHVFGLQIDSVERLELITPEGALRRLSRHDDLFGLVLVGRGQLGAISSATLRTIARRPTVVARLLVWESASDFLADAPSLTAFEYLRARRFWQPDRVEAIAGSFGGRPPEASLERITRARISRSWETIDLSAEHRAEPPVPSGATPAVELTLPIEIASDVLGEIDEILASQDILQFLSHGASLSVVPPSPLPLAPVAHDRPSLFFALCPEMRPSRARASLDALRSIGALALARGGKLHGSSVEPEPFDLRAQFGGALESFRASKELLDPKDLVNPGLLAPIGER